MVSFYHINISSSSVLAGSSAGNNIELPPDVDPMERWIVFIDIISQHGSKK